jgi:hypothetical protein
MMRIRVTQGSEQAGDKGKHVPAIVIIVALLIVFVSLAIAGQDKYTLKVPNGLSFSEFRGYEDWQVVAPSQTDAQNVMRVILANPVMMKAYREGVPANGKPFPDGSKIAKIEWEPKKITDAPFSVKTPVPHLASLPCGGLSAKVPGRNASDAAPAIS